MLSEKELNDLNAEDFLSPELMKKVKDTKEFFSKVSESLSTGQGLPDVGFDYVQVNGRFMTPKEAEKRHNDLMGNPNDVQRNWLDVQQEEQMKAAARDANKEIKKDN